MGQRRDRLDGRLARQKSTRIRKSTVKELERGRRESQMLELLKGSSAPYSPAVMNWVSVQLGKKTARVTEADIKTLIA
ncbi:MAG: hypothetical protein JEZ07_10520 [Phycisphaerae bacterium]|nr:hypothetical protein [Phycisphaerae bacterium]